MCKKILLILKILLLRYS